MRKSLLMIFAACCWITLLAAVVTTLVRLSTDAKERRGHTAAAQLSKPAR
ncbi:hypothetical protein [Bradyrhizobium japonicum]|nr:hypothetical protein [Bradyrhizobium japonicum]WLB24220.1 hypothetical protein QIH95_47480 [Bradyrhizobium japonicum]